MEKWEKDEAEKTKHCSSLYIFTTDGDRDKELMAKCLRLILHGKVPMRFFTKMENMSASFNLVKIN
jgi:hypothetical protein